MTARILLLLACMVTGIIPALSQNSVCRLPSDVAERYNGGDRDCRAHRVDSNGSCYCRTAIGLVRGQTVSTYRGNFGGGYGGGSILRCRVSSEASRYTGGDRDCSVRSAGRGGTCYCPSSVGPIQGQIVRGY